VKRLTGGQDMNEITKTALAYCLVILSLNAGVAAAVMASLAH